MARPTLKEFLSKGIVIGDGAMGTMLYDAGVFLNRCFDELNLSAPQLVKKVHDSYAQAGVDFIETNTFGANQFKLAKYGLAEQVENINRAAVEIAKASAGERVLVAGSVGPLGSEIKHYDKSARKLAMYAFRRQIKALTEAKADFLMLETFSNTEELLIAIEAARQTTDLIIVAQMTCDENNETIYGQRIDLAISRLSLEDSVFAVGLNCSVGPAGMLEALELIRKVTDKPISVQPNAGLPRQVDNRTLYMCTPEYMAEYARRFFEKGAKIIGGCCGTTPRHIEEIVKVLRSLEKAAISAPKTAQTQIRVGPPAKIELKEPVPLSEKSKLGKKLAAGEKITTIEITPPKGIAVDGILAKAKLCAENGIDAINIPDGPRASCRLSPMVTAVKIQQQVNIETILHFCCRDRNLIAVQSDLLGAFAIGLRNILVITGDPPKLGDYPKATGVFDLDSIALTNVIRNLNCGVDVGGNRLSEATSLTIGVGANPAASEIAREIDRFRQKVESGAEYAVTQPVFDCDILLNFLDAVEKFKIPVVAGIWPFVSYKNAEFMANEVPGVVVPDKLLERMSKAGTREDARKSGVEIAREMIDKISKYVSGFAVSAPFGNVKTALAVLGKIELSRFDDD